MTTHGSRRARPPQVADPETTVIPSAEEARDVAPPHVGPPSGEELVAAILRYLRRWPNETVDLAPLAEELGVDPPEMQLTAERLHQARFVVAPFIVPSRAGGATLAQRGLEWLLAREGGEPVDVPIAYQKADAPVRAGDEAARLPRSQVYGVRRTPSGGAG